MDATEQKTDEPVKEHSLELLSFVVGSHEYSVDIMAVREIRGWTETTSLPHSPSYVRGVINLRGTVLPVIDLAVRLGLEAGEVSERNVIIVVDIDNAPVGMRVDAVSDILTVKKSDLIPPPEFTEDISGTFLSAVTLLNEKMIRVLDLSSTMPRKSEVAA
ncbi:MAG: chemotaxis protein CheW [Pseudomonadota bacterium]